MVKESLQFFSGLQLCTFFDGTLGAGGHAKAFLEAHPEITQYVGCDKDPQALQITQENLQEWKEKIEFVHADFADLDQILSQRGIQEVNGFFLT